MKMSDFESIVEDAVNKIPRKFRAILEKENIQLLPREKAPEILQNRFKNSWVFGIFIGVPYNKRSVFNIEREPTRIELYQNSFEKAFKRRREMEEQIVKTVIHEIGHYFGFSEKELRQRRL